MNEESAVREKTSRRAFKRSVVAALASAPIVGSMVGCTSQGNQNPTVTTTAPTPSGTATPTPTPSTGPVKKSSCNPVPCHDDHIPPMELEGGGSLRIELKQKLAKTNNQPPFVYQEDGIQNPALERMGNLKYVRVITDMDDCPFVLDDLYGPFSPGAKLQLWYHNIKTPQDIGDLDDVTFDPSQTFPTSAPPDVSIVGGAGQSNVFQMTLKSKKLSNKIKSHKRHRPNRYLHEDGSGLARHFRIGQWRIVDSSGTALFEHSKAENYHFYLTYDDFQP